MKQSSLAETLRVLRARQDLTITEAASSIGITRETLRDLEHGTRNPYYPTLEKIAKAYGVTVEELMLPAHEERPAKEPVLTGKAEAPETAQLTAQLREWIGTAGHVRRMIHEDIDELQCTRDLPRGWERGVFGTRMVYDNVGLLTGSDHAEQLDPELVLAAKQAANATLNDVFRFFEEVEEVEEVADRPEISPILRVLSGGKDAA